jgi:interferon-induced transmembrane protein
MSTPDDPQNPYGTGGQPPQEPIDPATGAPRSPAQPPYGAPTPYGSPAPYGSDPQNPAGTPYPGAPQYGAPQFGGPQYGAPQYGGQQYGGPGYPTSPPPANYLVWAILTTVLCCLPLGVVSIVFSSQVNTKWGQGDWAGAQASSKKAKNFAIWSAIVGGTGIAIWIVLAVIGGITSDTTY